MASEAALLLKENIDLIAILELQARWASVIVHALSIEDKAEG